MLSLQLRLANGVLGKLAGMRLQPLRSRQHNGRRAQWQVPHNCRLLAVEHAVNHVIDPSCKLVTRRRAAARAELRRRHAPGWGRRAGKGGSGARAESAGKLRGASGGACSGPAGKQQHTELGGGERRRRADTPRAACRCAFATSQPLHWLWFMRRQAKRGHTPGCSRCLYVSASPL